MEEVWLSSERRVRSVDDRELERRIYTSVELACVQGARQRLVVCVSPLEMRLFCGCCSQATRLTRVIFPFRH